MKGIYFRLPSPRWLFYTQTLVLAGTTSSKKLHLKDTSLPTALAFRLNLASHATKKASKTPRKAVFWLFPYLFGLILVRNLPRDVVLTTYRSEFLTLFSRSHEERAGLTAPRGFLLSIFVTCAAGRIKQNIRARLAG